MSLIRGEPVVTDHGRDIESARSHIAAASESITTATTTCFLDPQNLHKLRVDMTASSKYSDMLWPLFAMCAVVPLFFILFILFRMIIPTTGEMIWAARETLLYLEGRGEPLYEMPPPAYQPVA
jgi:hypothetical protein